MTAPIKLVPKIINLKNNKNIIPPPNKYMGISVSFLKNTNKQVKQIFPSLRRIESTALLIWEWENCEKRQWSSSIESNILKYTDFSGFTVRWMDHLRVQLYLQDVSYCIHSMVLKKEILYTVCEFSRQVGQESNGYKRTEYCFQLIFFHYYELW